MKTINQFKPLILNPSSSDFIQIKHKIQNIQNIHPPTIPSMSRQSPQKKKKIQVMRQLCLQRKQSNFQNLKQWDQLRASKLIIHRKIVDQIDQSLEVKLSQSNEYAKIVRQYFTDLLTQKNRYLTHQFQNPQPKLLQNAIGRHVYPTAARTLVKLYGATQNSRQLAMVKKVLQESLQKIDDFFMEGERQLMQLRTKIQLSVLQVQDCNMQTLKKCDSLVSIYNTGKTLKPFQSQQDFFMQQQGFLQQARKQLASQKQLGTQIVSYLQFVQKKQIQKLALLKHLIGNYITSVKLSHQGQQQHLANLYDILHKNTQSKYIQEYFSVEELLTREIITQLARVQKKHETQCLGMKVLKGFLRRLEYEEFDNRNLVLKAVKVFMRPVNLQEQKPQTQPSNKQDAPLQPIQLYITVDGFINIYHAQHPSAQQQSNHQQQQPHKTLNYTLKISASLVFKRVADLELQINVKKWGLMSFSQTQEDQLRIVFNSQDQREEFLEFIAQLK